MKTTLAILVVSFGLAGLNTIQAQGVGAQPPLDATGSLPLPPEAGELRFPIDLSLLREEFRRSGTVTLPAPVLGEVQVIGQENELTSHGNRTQNLPHIHILGSAVGHPDSTANILIGEYGVYGRVEIPQPLAPSPLVLDFNAVETEPGSFLQSVRVRDAASQPSEAGPVRPPGLPVQANHTHERGIHVAPPQPSLALSSSETYYYDDDGTMEATMHMDYTNDWAIKSISLPSDALKGGTSATASLDGKAEGCGGATNNAFTLSVNGNTVLSFDPCAAWSTASHRRYTVDVPLWMLVPGANNQISISDSSHWTTRNAYFGIDTQHDNGRTDVHQCESGNCPSGDNINGELLWSLIIRTTNPPPPPPKEECQRPMGPWAKPDPEGQGTSTARGASSPPDPCDETPDCSGGYGISWVTYHAEQGFVDAHSDWRDRIVSAAAKYSPMWQLLCISLRVWPVNAGASILTSSSCADGEVATQYRDWLASTWANSLVFFNDDAYQLWTDRDLQLGSTSPTTAYCFGRVFNHEKVDITRTSPTFDASSVIEGVDFCCTDTYNAGDVHERGIVSGHELAHLYGEENHPYECPNKDWRGGHDCNIMRNCKEPRYRNFYFTQGSKKEILFRYHYASEATSGYEGMAACP